MKKKCSEGEMITGGILVLFLKLRYELSAFLNFFWRAGRFGNELQNFRIAWPLRQQLEREFPRFLSFPNSEIGKSQLLLDVGIFRFKLVGFAQKTERSGDAPLGGIDQAKLAYRDRVAGNCPAWKLLLARSRARPLRAALVQPVVVMITAANAQNMNRSELFILSLF